MPSQPSDQFIDRTLLLQLAGPKAFARGEAYFAENRVRHLQAAPDRATAKVSGTRTYRVKLWQQRGSVHHACTCAAGREEVFCKHCVALGLAWLDAMAAAQADPATVAAGGSAQIAPRALDEEMGISREQLRDYLRALDKDRLVSLTLEATDYDDILHRRLLLEVIGVTHPGAGKKSAAAAAQPSARRQQPPNFELYVHVLREAIECADYVDYNSMGDYAQGVEEAIRPLGELLKTGHAAAVVELAEFALLELDRSSDMIDTGDGALNAIYDDLQQFHLEACRLAQPDPEALAARLLEYELEGGLGVFNNAVNTYAAVLGAEGLAAWRRLLMAEWSSLPLLGAASKKRDAASPAGALDYRRFQINALMERLARTEGDAATLLAVKQRDLSSAHDFLALVELHLAQGRPEEAARWAEIGLKTFPDEGASSGLSGFLTGVYAQLDRRIDALNLLWEDFARSSSLEDFHELRDYAREVNPSGWPAWRERVIAHLRGQLSPEAPDRTRLVEILLADDLDAEAWAEAKAPGVIRPDLWLEIASRREHTHPADALRVYQDQLGPTIARGNPAAYRQAIALLTRIGHLLDQLGRADDFGTFQAEIRAANRQKRSFLKLLDTIKRPPGVDKGGS